MRHQMQRVLLAFWQVTHALVIRVSAGLEGHTHVADWVLAAALVVRGEYESSGARGIAEQAGQFASSQNCKGGHFGIKLCLCRGGRL